MRLAVTGFRNLAPVTVRFAEDANYIYGPNGAGKTSLLEAIHWLAIGRSFRRCTDTDLLGFGAELVAVSGWDDQGRQGEVRFDGREKCVLLDGGRLDRLSDFLGWLPVVVLLLDDIELVRGGPGVRRAFLDMTVAKVRRDYIGRLNDYRRVLLQRNRLLEQDAAEELHLTWEAELARTGAAVYELRIAVVRELLPWAAARMEQFGLRDVELQYLASVPAGPDLSARMAERLAATRLRSRELGQTVVGPHRDDVTIKVGGRDLRRFGSVGEQRLAGVALRLAEGELLARKRRERPTFLLDEIASELDEQRCRLVLDAVSCQGQVIYAAARRLPAELTAGRKEFAIAQGRIEEVSADQCTAAGSAEVAAS